MISKQKKSKETEIAKEEVFLKQKSLLQVGFGFEAIKNMVDQGVSFGKIAETLNSVLEEGRIDRVGSQISAILSNGPMTEEGQNHVARLTNGQSKGTGGKSLI